MVIWPVSIAFFFRAVHFMPCTLNSHIKDNLCSIKRSTGQFSLLFNSAHQNTYTVISDVMLCRIAGVNGSGDIAFEPFTPCCIDSHIGNDYVCKMTKVNRLVDIHTMLHAQSIRNDLHMFTSPLYSNSFTGCRSGLEFL